MDIEGNGRGGWDLTLEMGMGLAAERLRAWGWEWERRYDIRKDGKRYERSAVFGVSGRDGGKGLFRWHDPSGGKLRYFVCLSGYSAVRCRHCRREKRRHPGFERIWSVGEAAGAGKLYISVPPCHFCGLSSLQGRGEEYCGAGDAIFSQKHRNGTEDSEGSLWIWCRQSGAGAS